MEVIYNTEKAIYFLSRTGESDLVKLRKIGFGWFRTEPELFAHHNYKLVERNTGLPMIETIVLQENW